jgi:hypothetical protein
MLGEEYLANREVQMIAQPPTPLTWPGGIFLVSKTEKKS